MKYKIFLIILTGLFLINFSSADGDIGIVKQFECIDLYNYCPTCSYINLTAIQYPNGSVLFNATLTANQIDFKDSAAVVEKYNLGSNFRGWVG